jgi:proline iminopeptidase
MHITVNGSRLFFDVEGSKLAPDGPRMREKPTLLLLHGGPGADHSLFRLRHGRFADIAQVIYLDQRGMGRSDRGAPEHWTMAQWGEDVKAFCDALGIEKPIVLGVSFGGYVAQEYATRYPDHPGKLILEVSAARPNLEASVAAFTRHGGVEAGNIARAFLTSPSPEVGAAFAKTCLPLYRATPEPDENADARTIWNFRLNFGFFTGEERRIDYRARLGAIACPVLVISGAKDLILPPELQDELMACLPRGRGELLRLGNTAHIITGEWDAYEAGIRRFILGSPTK